MPDPTPLFTPNDSASSVVFTVEEVRGEEEMNRPFRFELRLSAATPVDHNEVINKSFTLKLRHPQSDQDIEGIVSDLRVLSKDSAQGDTFYHATLVPKHWLLGLSHRSRVFQNAQVHGIVKALLQGVITLADTDYDLMSGLSMKETVSGVEVTRYPWREFTAQYQESDLDFLHRLIESDGIYYFFKDGVLFFVDDKANEGTTATPITYYPVNNAPSDETCITSFTLSHRIVPKQVHVRDYDYAAHEETMEDIRDTDPTSGTAGTSEGRFGTYYEHGRYALNDKGFASTSSMNTAPENEPDPGRDYQVKRIAMVRAEEVECRHEVLAGIATEPKFRPGVPITLNDSTNGPLDGLEYLLTSVTHTFEGGVYTNHFEAIPKDTQYRPPRRTPVPRVPGVMTAKVASYPPEAQDTIFTSQNAGDKPYEDAQAAYEAAHDLDDDTSDDDDTKASDVPVNLDDEGRYQVRFPFPHSETQPDNLATDGASTPLRLSQPYSGADYGIHFPNRAGTEMVFAFLDGDPDRPLGLGTVPTPWTHTPVPNEENKLSSQNPITKGPKGRIPYRETKNVIKTHVGHQIVMDDDAGGANVGITIQAGKSKNSAGRNVYWGSKLELGGYREKSNLEIGLDSTSHVVGWLGAAFTRNYPALASNLAALIASQVTTDNYLDDTYGTTTPVGVNLFTKKDINITGKDGVNITSPNLFGMFSSDLILGPDSDDPRSYMEAISKFVMNTIWQDVMNTAADEVLDTQKKVEEYKKKGTSSPKLRAAFQHELDLKKKRISELVFTLLQQSGVKISSAGELKLASVQATNIAAGQGGFSVKSYGSIEQKADLSVAIESHEGIKLSTKGAAYEGDGIIAAVKKLGTHFPMLGRLLAKLPSQPRVSQPFVPDPDDAFPILLENEKGNILLNTGPADVMAHADEGGNVKSFADTGLVHGWSGKGVVLEVGDRKGLSGDDVLLPLEDSKVKTRVQMSDKSVEAHAAEVVQLGTGKVGSGPLITINKDSIELKCGQSSLLMKKNGDITIKGKKILQQATSDITLKGSNITSKANMNNKMDGTNLKLKASLDATVEGTMFNAKGKLTNIKGSLIKAGA